MKIIDGDGNDQSWSSRGLPPPQALRSWQCWASETLAPMHIDVPDGDRFAAAWRSHAVGPLRLVELHATPQRVVHRPEDGASHRESTFQLVYCMQTPIAARVGAERFRVKVGEFVLLDSGRSYEVRMDGANKAIDVIIPRALLELWLPDPLQYVGRPFSASTKWGLPLGIFLSTTAREIENAALPRMVIADQLGTLLALAVGYQPAIASRHKADIAKRLLQLIEERHSDPELDPAEIAKEVRISKRYLHAVLAESGTTFHGALSRTRLDRASKLLADPRFGQQQIAEISWQCGYLDPSYFARVFSRRFGLGPRAWRNHQQR